MKEIIIAIECRGKAIQLKKQGNSFVILDNYKEDNENSNVKYLTQRAAMIEFNKRVQEVF